MKFYWGPLNTAHVERHVPRSLAEKVAEASDFRAFKVSRDSLALSGYSTVDGVEYFITAMRTIEQTETQICIMTCYRSRRGSRKRRKP